MPITQSVLPLVVLYTFLDIYQAFNLSTLFYVHYAITVLSLFLAIFLKQKITFILLLNIFF